MAGAERRRHPCAVPRRAGAADRRRVLPAAARYGTWQRAKEQAETIVSTHRAAMLRLADHLAQHGGIDHPTAARLACECLPKPPTPAAVPVGAQPAARVPAVPAPARVQ